MKILAVILIVLALLVGIAPQFTNCDYAKSMAGPTDMDTTTPAMSGSSTMSTMAATTMTTAAAAAKPSSKPRCLWTARAEIATAAPLLAMGILLFFARRKETKRALSILAVIEGIFIVLLPATLIGLCLSSTMTCRTQMEPIVYAGGALVMVVGLAALVWNELKREA